MSATKTDTQQVKHAGIAAALAAVQTEIPAVAKGETAEVLTKSGQKYHYQYAPLEVITPLILPLLGRNGLAWSAQPTLMGDVFVLHYALTHESGEAIEGIYPLPDPMAIKPQQLGEAITYARRYALCAVTGVAPGGDDDDAAGANDKPASSRVKKTLPPKAKPEPVKPAVASHNWAADVLDVNSVEDLRQVHVKAVEAGELGCELDPQHAKFTAAAVKHFGSAEMGEHATVRDLVQSVKAALQQRDTAAQQPTPESLPESAPDRVTEWPTREPGSGLPERDPDA